jgi:hypothetical protein
MKSLNQLLFFTLFVLILSFTTSTTLKRKNKSKSFKVSCNTFKYDADSHIFSAKCKKIDLTETDASIDLGTILKNNDGGLENDSAKVGQFFSTCRGCSLDTDKPTIRCECKRANCDTYKVATIDLNDDLKLVNRDGVLQLP